MRHYYFYAFALLFLFSCRKDEVDNTPIYEPPRVTTVYTKDITGLVLNMDGLPISDASVAIEGQAIITDSLGFYQIKNVKINNVNGNFIKASHPDYFVGGRRVYAASEDDTYAVITLIPKSNPNRLTESGGEIVINKGVKLEFKPNGFALNGAPYAGPVDVFAHWISPEDDDFLNLSPGDLSAINEGGQQGILSSFGMLSVEMLTPGGQEVTLLEGFPATMVAPIPPALIAEAEDEVPLWHFDEVKGIWIEEGKVVKKNNTYEGTLPHFSWWNIDKFSSGIVNLCIQLVQPTRNSYFSQILVELVDDVFGVGRAYTDDDGRVCGLIPSGRELTMNIYDLCENLIYSAQIGPYTAFENEELVTVTLSNNQAYTFTGNVYECQTTNPLSNVPINISSGGIRFTTTTDANGYYDETRLLCNATQDYEIFCIDPNSSLSQRITGTAQSNTLTNNDLILCDENEFLLISDPNTTIFFENPILKVKPYETLMYDENTTIMIGIKGSGLGTFETSVFSSQPATTEYVTTFLQWGPVNTIIRGKIELPDGSPFATFAVTRQE